jgi:hypothetical protein
MRSNSTHAMQGERKKKETRHAIQDKRIKKKQK